MQATAGAAVVVADDESDYGDDWEPDPIDALPEASVMFAVFD